MTRLLSRFELRLLERARDLATVLNRDSEDPTISLLTAASVLIAAASIERMDGTYDKRMLNDTLIAFSNHIDNDPIKHAICESVNIVAYKAHDALDEFKKVAEGNHELLVLNQFAQDYLRKSSIDTWTSSAIFQFANDHAVLAFAVSRSIFTDLVNMITPSTINRHTRRITEPLLTHSGRVLTREICAQMFGANLDL